jgi:thiosulfate reductase cytochrome b subunit
MYGLYERFWHWTQALCIGALLATGGAIHWPEILPVGSFKVMVVLHMVAAVLLFLNAFLGLFYHLATGAIQAFMPEPRDFFTLAIKQVRYYTGGIFRGEPHPFARRKGQKMNVIQQMTYLGILNVLLPGQILLGVMLAMNEVAPSLLAPIGGLTLIAPLHLFLAWVFLSFIIGHIYMTTTGPTPLAYLRAMITGWEDVHE